MFRRIIEVRYTEGTVLQAVFQDGIVKQYDVSVLFNFYPQFKVLKDRKKLTSGYLQTPYGITWNDALDLSAEEIYENGITVGAMEIPLILRIGERISEIRASKHMTQLDLAKLTGIDQSDISKIERGLMNPSIKMLERIAKGLGAKLNISLENSEE